MRFDVTQTHHIVTDKKSVTWFVPREPKYRNGYVSNIFCCPENSPLKGVTVKFDGVLFENVQQSTAQTLYEVTGIFFPERVTPEKIEKNR